jgi:hypothetical protein
MFQHVQHHRMSHSLNDLLAAAPEQWVLSISVNNKAAALRYLIFDRCNTTFFNHCKVKSRQEVCAYFLSMLFHNQYAKYCSAVLQIFLTMFIPGPMFFDSA